MLVAAAAVWLGYARKTLMVLILLDILGTGFAAYMLEANVRSASSRWRRSPGSSAYSPAAGRARPQARRRCREGPRPAAARRHSRRAVSLGAERARSDARRHPMPRRPIPIRTPPRRRATSRPGTHSTAISARRSSRRLRRSRPTTWASSSPSGRCTPATSARGPRSAKDGRQNAARDSCDCLVGDAAVRQRHDLCLDAVLSHPRRRAGHRQAQMAIQPARQAGGVDAA